MSVQQDIETLIEDVRKANDSASYLGLDCKEGDARDHLMQAHFRLTEAVAHLRVARSALRREADTGGGEP